MVYNVRRANRKMLDRCRSMRVFLNGRDVTRDCFYVDRRRGVVRRYRRMPGFDEYFISLDGKLATEELRGRVTLRRMP